MSIAKEDVRDELLTALRVKITEVSTEFAQHNEVSAQEYCIALLQIAGAAVAAYSAEVAPKDHQTNIAWAVRNLVGVYGQVMGVSFEQPAEAPANKDATH